MTFGGPDRPLGKALVLWCRDSPLIGACVVARGAIELTLRCAGIW